MKKLTSLSFALLLTATTSASQNWPTQKFNAAALAADSIPEEKDSKLEKFADLPGPMLRGLTISSKGRVFITFPRIGGNNSYTIAELKDGKAVPYPNADSNQAERAQPAEHIFSVMSAVADNKDRLWIADTGRLGQKAISGAAKLIGIDLATDKVIKTVVIPPAMLSERSVLHDLRYDPSKGKDGAVYITDACPGGKAAILVVDLASGDCLKRLAGHKSVQPEAGFLPIVRGRPMVRTLANGKKEDFVVGVAGLAVRADGKVLYYCPQACRQLYSVDANLLSDPKATESQVESSVKDLGPKPAASDGLECDKDGNIYFADFENGMIWVRRPDGKMEKVVHDTRLIWPDSLWIGHDGYLYISCSHFNELAAFNEGTDKRTKTYQIFRCKINAAPTY